MSKTACVTGGNGYIASALIKMLLEKGYAVKTTVRNPGPIPLPGFSVHGLWNWQCFVVLWFWIPDDTEKNSHLKELQALGPLEVFGADLDEDGSFDDAVAGCHYAFLVAAPVNIHAKNPEVN
jgi:anthocyanidin reductase